MRKNLPGKVCCIEKTAPVFAAKHEPPLGSEKHGDSCRAAAEVYQWRVVRDSINTRDGEAVAILSPKVFTG
jgi:hypothetical protein